MMTSSQSSKYCQRYVQGSGPGRRQHRTRSSTVTTVPQVASRDGHSRHGSRNRSAGAYRDRRYGTRPSNASDSNILRQAASSSEEPQDDIGFYYDRQKKKYFRIVPGQNNANASVVTRDVVREKQAEARRQEDLKQAGTFMQCHSAGKVHRKKCPRLSGSNIVRLANLMQAGTLTGTNVQRIVSRHMVSRLEPCGQTKAFESLSAGPHIDDVSHMAFMVPNADFSSVLCLWMMDGNRGQLVQMLNISDMKRNDEHGSVSMSVRPAGGCLRMCRETISDMCLAGTGLNSECEEGRILFLSSDLPLDYMPCRSSSVAHLYDLNRNTRLASYSCTQSQAWCCAWNKHAQQLSVGSERQALLFAGHRSTAMKVLKTESDVLAQAFSQENGKILYSGTRAGKVHAHHTRGNRLFQLHDGSRTSVCHIHCGLNDNYLTVAGFSDKISMWDLRQRKIVLNFSGHRNDYHKLPVHVCEEQQMVYAVGIDSYTRVWCQRTGELLCSIPPPYPACVESLPTVCYSPHLGYGSGYPALLLGVRNELHIYA